MLFYCVLFLQLIYMIISKDIEENGDPKQEQVVVRAVFINCNLNEEQNMNEIEGTRFQREELFKHSALQGCRKKLALTVKIASEPDKSTGDEYIPIEHVFDGSSNKRRARLLDPYILRLRRDTPLQAYKLRRIDTVIGIVTKADDRRSSKFKKNRVQRNLNDLSEKKNFINSRDREGSLGPVRDPEYLSSTTIYKPGNTQQLTHCGITDATNLSHPKIPFNPKGTLLDASSSDDDVDDNTGGSFSEHQEKRSLNQHVKVNTRVKRDSCTLANNPAWKRDKRHEHNIIVEDITDDYKIPWTVQNRFYRRLDHVTNSRQADTGDVPNEGHEKNIEKEMLTKTKIRPHKNAVFQNEPRRVTSERGSTKQRHDNVFVDDTKQSTKLISLKEFSTPRGLNKEIKNAEPEKNFVLYDIGNPDLWYTVHVQLFEKMSTPEGKTVWNDITKGEVARVSTFQPEWTDSDLNVRYKPTEWMSKDEFALPSASNLCLLAPIHNDGSIDLNDEVIGLNNNGKYLVVPKEDIVSLEDTESLLNKRNRNYSDTTTSDSSTREEQGHPRVLVRVSRALLTDYEEEMKISTVGTDRFLSLPHRRPHRAQIDLEARADENQLIRVGSSGSLITIVSDNSRRTRSVITVQATNKGLAAARFRVKARDCGPEMAGVVNEKSDSLIAGPILVPPRHTQRFRLELPAPVPVDTIHCSVALINDDDEAVAVRDVEIKKSDRCFCVWHCECVCLNVDPKLLCREMPEARQTAAGLSPRERARRARSVCYSDCVTINLFVIIIGVIIIMLLLGLVKACFGLFCRCVGKWGLDKLIQCPRKLEHYFEPSLQGRDVVYDEEGWPVHPDTQKRSVRFISKSMEFILNVVFFIVLPCLLLRDAIIQLVSRSKLRRADTVTLGGDDKKCFSTQDMQGLHPRWRRRRAGLRRWMTPPAEELSTDIWSKGLTARKSVECEFMKPLLQRHTLAEDAPSSCADSEQDDTEYVLMQMQKSKESLARSQKKPNEPGTSSAKKQLNSEEKLSHTITH